MYIDSGEGDDVVEYSWQPCAGHGLCRTGTCSERFIHFCLALSRPHPLSGSPLGFEVFDDADAFYQRCLGQFFALLSEHVRQGSLNRETKPVADRFSPFECPLAAPGMVLLTFLVLGSLLWLNTVSGIFMQQAGVASGVYMKKGHRPQLFSA